MKKMEKWKKLLISFFILPCVITFSSCSCSGKDSSNNNGGGNITPTTYSVSFYTDSTESFNITPQIIESGKLVKRPTNPVKEGYVFIGWFKDVNKTMLWRFEVDPVNSNLTLYAKWEISEY